MSKNISVLVVFELSAILAGRTRDWSQYGQFGNCFVPQVVIEEIEFLCQRSPYPDEEKTAREFTRFLGESNWQVSQAIAKNPALNPPQGQKLSKNARLSLAIAQAVLGLARENQAQLVVLVSNQQNLRNEVELLEIKNLCTLTLVQFRQWVQTNQRPVNVTQQMQKMAPEGVAGFEVTTKKSAAASRAKPQSSSSLPTAVSYSARTQKYPTSAKTSNFFSNLMASIFAIVGFTVVGGLIWYLVQPDMFNQFWQKTGLPPLPNYSQPSQ